MCGICGRLNFDSKEPVHMQTLRQMGDAIEHRGPDDEGYYIEGNVGFGFRRLAIIDLDSGHQPLGNEDDSIQIVFNGEIYNFLELRQELLERGHRFKTKTDTEVIVHLYEEYGLDCLERLRGMFAFALWDSPRKRLFLARDRVGIKPLYYRSTSDSLIFASEIRSILVNQDVDASPSFESITKFFTYLYVPGEATLFAGISKLLPGHALTVERGRITKFQYWDNIPTEVIHDVREAEERLESLLKESVALHMRSDVPVGFLLSGGVDSTAMVALCREICSNEIDSYTIGFDSPGVIDERPYAALAAQRFGTRHHELTIGPEAFKEFIPKYIRFMEEPVCEPPAVALYYVARLARQDVKVLISGEGSDEAFAGYQNYRSIMWLEALKRIGNPLQTVMRGGVNLSMKIFDSDRVQRYGSLYGEPFTSYYYSRSASPFSFFCKNRDQIYTSELLEHTKDFAPTEILRSLMNKAGSSSVLGKMLYVDLKTWLPDDLLIKADKMTMANSLELRVPFLDHKILEFSSMLASDLKVKGFNTKYILKRCLKDRVPREIIQRKKAGLPIPYVKWLRDDLRTWVADVLLDSTTRHRGYFRQTAIEALIKDNRDSGRYSKEIFSLLIFELWHREFAPGFGLL